MTVGYDFRERGLWRDTTVVDDLLTLARDAPTRTAVVTCYWSQPGRPPVALTYAELAARVDRAAAGFVELGVGAGDRVAMLFTNSWQATVTALACARIGAVVMPVFVATGAAEVLALLRHAEASVVCAPDWHGEQAVGAPIAAARGEVPSLRHVFVDGDPVPDGALSFADHLLGTPWEADLDARRPGGDDPFQVMYTSGTSGTPKGVLHSHNTLYAATRAYTVPMGFGPGDVLLTPMAVGGQAGFLYGLMAPLVAGGTAVWGDRLRTPEMLDSMRDYRVTGVYTLPSIAEEMIEEYRKTPRELALRHLVAGSAPIPATLPAEVRDTFGVALTPLWGMTENGGVTIGRADDDWDEATRSDGRPVDGMDVRVVDESGVPVPAGTAGSLQIRGANQCLGYYRADGAYAANLVDGGWFVTGDLARVDERGAVKIVGRLVDEVKRDGLVIPVPVVEDALRTHPAVREVALVGEPDRALGQRTVAFVVPDGDPPTRESLGDAVAAAGLNPLYRPDRVEYLDALPRNPAGKVLRRELRDRLAGG
ncbi:MAG TPA: AMP-binding protein [Actinocatenispora sp.]